MKKNNVSKTEVKSLKNLQIEKYIIPKRGCVCVNSDIYKSIHDETSGKCSKDYILNANSNSTSIKD